MPIPKVCPNRKVNDKGRKIELGFEKGQLQMTIEKATLSSMSLSPGSWCNTQLSLWFSMQTAQQSPPLKMHMWFAPTQIN